MLALKCETAEKRLVALRFRLGLIETGRDYARRLERRRVPNRPKIDARNIVTL
jgi:hypothetical protein